MAEELNYLDKLEKLKTIAANPDSINMCNSVFSEIRKKTNHEIPSFVCNIFYNSKLITECCSGIFLGFNTLSLDEIKSIYDNVNAPNSFFSTYKVDGSFNVGEDRSIVIEEYKEKGRFDVEIKNVGSLLPLFNFQGDYIVVNLDPKKFGELMIISSGHLANILAPNLSAHITDLISGLESGIYKERDGDLIYPSVWEDRQALREGKLVMDEYGEVSKL